MALEDYQMEQERRINSLASQVATTRETMRNIEQRFDKLEDGQHDIQSSVNQINAFTQKMEATLKYNIDAQIDAKMAPHIAAINTLREESIIRKTQIAMWCMFGSGFGAVLVMLGGQLLKLMGVS